MAMNTKYLLTSNICLVNSIKNKNISFLKSIKDAFVVGVEKNFYPPDDSMRISNLKNDNRVENIVYKRDRDYEYSYAIFMAFYLDFCLKNYRLYGSFQSNINNTIFDSAFKDSLKIYLESIQRVKDFASLLEDLYKIYDTTIVHNNVDFRDGRNNFWDPDLPYKSKNQKRTYFSKDLISSYCVELFLFNDIKNYEYLATSLEQENLKKNSVYFYRAYSILWHDPKKCTLVFDPQIVDFYSKINYYSNSLDDIPEGRESYLNEAFKKYWTLYFIEGNEMDIEKQVGKFADTVQDQILIVNDRFKNECFSNRPVLHYTHNLLFSKDGIMSIHTLDKLAQMHFDSNRTKQNFFYNLVYTSFNQFLKSCPSHQISSYDDSTLQMIGSFRPDFKFIDASHLTEDHFVDKKQHNKTNEFMNTIETIRGSFPKYDVFLKKGAVDFYIQNCNIVNAKPCSRKEIDEYINKRFRFDKKMDLYVIKINCGICFFFSSDELINLLTGNLYSLEISLDYNISFDDTKILSFQFIDTHCMYMLNGK